MQIVKFLRCKDIGTFPKCEQMIEGQTEEEVLTKARAHAKEYHGKDLTGADIETLKKHIVEKNVSC
ncbi:MAG: DUF1059 domain-containing protein [Nitrospirota bacterium]